MVLVKQLKVQKLGFHLNSVDIDLVSATILAMLLDESEAAGNFDNMMGLCTTPRPIERQSSETVDYNATMQVSACRGVLTAEKHHIYTRDFFLWQCCR